MSSARDKGKTIGLAEKYVKKGKLQDAISEYKKLLKGDSQEINVRNIISNLYLRSNQKSKALEEFYKIAGFYEERGLYSQAMAVYKKISKLNPQDADAAMKLGDLYSRQGFLSEAKAEYLKIARDLVKNNRIKRAVFLYEKLKKLDRKDPQIKLSLAELYTREGSIDQAVEELNEVAELKIRSNDIKDAREILNRAKRLKGDHPRTLSNLIDLLKREDEKKEALILIDDILKKDKDNVKALRHMGSLYFDDQNFKKAEEIFSKVISLHPKDIEARVKLGQINILQDNLDQAFELYEPLVDTLIQKQKVDKAIGLLGLILSSKKAHVPTLEELASIYKSNNQEKNLEIVYRVILEEYHKRNSREESLSVLTELIRLCPEDEEIYSEYSLLRKKFGPIVEQKEAEIPLEEVKEAEVPLSEEKEAEEPIVEPKEAEMRLEEVREAEEPIVEPKEAVVPLEEAKEAELPLGKEKEAEEPIVEPKEAEVSPREEKESEVAIEEAKEVEEPIVEEKEVEVPLKEEKEAKELFKETERVEKIFEEAREGGAALEEKKEAGVRFDLLEGTEQRLEMSLAQADLYVEQGLLRNARRILENLRISFPDEPRIEQKLDSISNVSSQAKVDEILQRVEKVSAEETKLFGKKAYFRFNLGIAFLEQGLIDEAIEEFKLASKDKSRTVECYTVISNCYRQKKDFQEATKWLKKALKIAEEGSDWFFALKYELASLYEDLKEVEMALGLYNEIKKWNSEYKDVAKKIKILEKRL